MISANISRKGMSWVVIMAGMLLLAASGPRSSYAGDVFLTMGGGGSPGNNQVSLEKNVQFFERMLGSLKLSDRPYDLLFADGAGPGRDLQFDDPANEVPQINLWLGRLLGSSRDLRFQYRSNTVGRDSNASTKAGLERWLKAEGEKLKPEDRLVFYFTGHGGRASGKEKHNTKLYLWNGESLKVNEMVQRLDRVPQQTPVVLVMVQCFSGGFANVIFKEGNPSKGLSDHARCGFFATIASRPAAGCTPSINEEDYQEYSSHFWAALYGETRTGKAIDRPDYDKDGVVSFAEAHAYSLLTSDSIDISIKTSDAFLRHFSKTKHEVKKPTKKPVKKQPAKDETKQPAKGEAKQPAKDEAKQPAKNEAKQPAKDEAKQPAKDEAKQPAKGEAKQPAKDEAKQDADPKQDEKEVELITVQNDWAALVEAAHPYERAVIDGLTAELEIDSKALGKNLTAKIKAIEAKRKELSKERGVHNKDYQRLRGEMAGVLKRRWPELSNRWHPMVSQFVTTDAPRILDVIKKDKRSKQIEELIKKISEIQENERDQEHRWVKCKRVEYVLESIALRMNLPKLVDDKIMDRFVQLVDAESSTLTPSTAAATP